MSKSDQLRREINSLTIELESKKRQLDNLEDNCNHKWSETEYDPENSMKQVPSGYDHRGSDVWPTYEMIPYKKDRWSRKCVHCGKTEYTYTQKPNTTYSPSFN
jgi:hypothetical protein